MGAQLHRILRNAIIQGELVPGQAISEVEMSKRFSISRQPVREAFIKLAEERLIEVLPQRGTYVRKISVKEMLGARHVREIIEVSIAREVALTRDADLIARLRQNIAAQRAVEPGDRKSILLIDDELHKSLALFAGLLVYGLLGSSRFAIVSSTSSSAAVLLAALVLTALLGSRGSVMRLLPRRRQQPTTARHLNGRFQP